MQIVVTKSFVYRFKTGGRIRIDPAFDDDGSPKPVTVKREVGEAGIAKKFAHEPSKAKTAAKPAAPKTPATPPKSEKTERDTDNAAGAAGELAAGDSGEGGPDGDGDGPVVDSGGDGAAAGADG